MSPKIDTEEPPDVPEDTIEYFQLLLDVMAQDEDNKFGITMLKRLDNDQYEPVIFRVMEHDSDEIIMIPIAVLMPLTSMYDTHYAPKNAQVDVFDKGERHPLQ